MTRCGDLCARSNATDHFKAIARFLSDECQLEVYVEEAVLEEEGIKDDESFQSLQPPLKRIDQGSMYEAGDVIDFVVCLGGDGTMLYVSSLFQVGFVRARSLARPP